MAKKPFKRIPGVLPRRPLRRGWHDEDWPKPPAIKPMHREIDEREKPERSLPRAPAEPRKD